MIRKGVGQPLPDLYSTYNSKCFGKWVHWSGSGLCSRIGSNMGSNIGSNIDSNMGSNIVPNIVPYIVPNMDFLGFYSIFIGGNGSGTVPWTCFSAFGNGSGTVPWTCFSALTQSTRTEARSRRTTAAKRNKFSFFRTYKCLQRTGVTTLAHWALLNESNWMWGKGWSLMWSSQRLKTLSCIQANPEALTCVLFQASSAERILIERESIWTMRVRWTMSLLIC